METVDKVYASTDFVKCHYCGGEHLVEYRPTESGTSFGFYKCGSTINLAVVDGRLLVIYNMYIKGG